jgi:F-type H+-transporting ATPase subunit a
MSSDNTHGSTTSHDEASTAALSPKDKIKKVVEEVKIGEHHRDFTLFQYPLFELPVIIYDAENGFDFYSGVHAMNDQMGDYHWDHHSHKIVKAKEGVPIEKHHESDPHADTHAEKSDHHEYETPTLDLSITNFIAYQLIAAIFVIFLFGKARSAYKKNPKKAPKGLQNLVEVFVLFVRDQVVRPNIPVRKIADSLTPYFITLFFFIYTMNMVGLLPGGHTPTSSLSITAALALTAFFVIVGYQIKQEGFVGFVKHLTAGAPIGVNLLMIVIEGAGLIIKPAVLAIRLFANMSAGHIVLFSFIALIFADGLSGTPFTLMALFVYILELLVAFIQAYIFTMLTAIFLGIGLHDENEQHAH